MKTNLMAAGIALMLVAMATPANAYHLAGSTHPGWSGPGNALITTCEGELTPAGFGGACFFSTDKNDTDDNGDGIPEGCDGAEDWCDGTTPLFNDNDYVKTNNVWSRVTAVDSTGVPVPGFYRVGVNAHGLDVGAGGSFYYKELLADWMDAGHVTYFPAFGAGDPFVDPVTPTANSYDAEFLVHSGAGMPADCQVTAGGHNGPGGTETFKSTTVCTDVLGSADDPISESVDLLLCVLDAVDAFVFDHNDPTLLAADLTGCLGL